MPELCEDGITTKVVSKYILDFNMKKLEPEYDYDTDEDQLQAARQMLMNDNFDAIQYFIHQDPLDLVGNFSNDD